jgi:hypothetical protein
VRARDQRQAPQPRFWPLARGRAQARAGTSNAGADVETRRTTRRRDAVARHEERLGARRLRQRAHRRAPRRNDAAQRSNDNACKHRVFVV